MPLLGENLHNVKRSQDYLHID